MESEILKSLKNKVKFSDNHNCGFELAIRLKKIDTKYSTVQLETTFTEDVLMSYQY